MKHLTLKAALTCSTLVFASISSAATLTHNLENIQVNNGEIRIAVFNSAETFTKKASHVMGVASLKESVSVTFDNIPVGEYAVMLFQDANGNEDLDTNLLGIPNEPWGASLNGTRVFGAPKWADVKFEVPKDGTQITVSMN